MKEIGTYQQDDILSEIFTKCFISLDNLSDSLFPNFQCTIWNKKPEGMLNIRSCWRFEFYANTPIEALRLGYKFLQKNREKDFNMTYAECLELRNQLNDSQK